MERQATHDAGGSADLPEAEIRAEIDRIVNSRAFAGSDRLCRFLTWVVEQTLRGQAENVKQYVIGREVFDRGANFDPRIDSIVRTEAQRLRRKLSEYYETEGASDRILVLFEPGSYTPAFRVRNGLAEVVKGSGPKLVSMDMRHHAVAVLPFLNLSADADQDYFCQGIAASIQELLASSPNMKVVSTYSAFRFGSAQDDLTRIGRDLGVDTIVKGSVQQVGTKIRVHARAMDAESGAYVWAQAFDREIQDIFAVQDEIAQAIVERVTGQPETEISGPSAAAPNPEAYKLYLQGRYLWNQLSVESLEKASECFLHAISVAPEYAQAYAALAEAFQWLILFHVRNAARLGGVTRRLALQALRFDRNCAEAYVVLGSVTAVLEWRWDEAEIFFQHGLKLRPSYLPGYLQRGFLCHAQKGNLETAEADVKKALELDPLSARSHRSLGVFLYMSGDYEGAIAAFERALEMEPEIKHSHYLLGLTLLQAERFMEAVTAIRKSFERSVPGAHLGALVAAYAAAGRRQEANEALRQLQDLSAHSLVSPVEFIHAYAALGRKSDALDWLEKAAEERCTGLMSLRVDPILDNVRDEPRFRAVLQKMRLV
jgi:TolB-like protein/Tfp pilus assembly protein PilF